jgi:hypothetical protein
MKIGAHGIGFYSAIALNSDGVARCRDRLNGKSRQRQ